MTIVNELNTFSYGTFYKVKHMSLRHKLTFSKNCIAIAKKPT